MNIKLHVETSLGQKFKPIQVDKTELIKSLNIKFPFRCYKFYLNNVPLGRFMTFEDYGVVDDDILIAKKDTMCPLIKDIEPYVKFELAEGRGQIELNECTNYFDYGHKMSVKNALKSPIKKSFLTSAGSKMFCQYKNYDRGASDTNYILEIPSLYTTTSLYSWSKKLGKWNDCHKFNCSKINSNYENNCRYKYSQEFKIDNFNFDEDLVYAFCIGFVPFLNEFDDDLFIFLKEVILNQYFINPLVDIVLEYVEKMSNNQKQTDSRITIKDTQYGGRDALYGGVCYYFAIES